MGPLPVMFCLFGNMVQNASLITYDRCRSLTLGTACLTQNHPMYASAHIFFTSKVAPQHLAALKGCPGLLSRLRALAEVPNCPQSECNPSQ